MNKTLLIAAIASTLSFAEIFNEAEAAAKEAAARHDAALPPEAQRGFDCGFAWVDVPDGRSPFVKWCKANGKGSKHYKKGWQFWNPSHFPTQSISTLFAGATAFATVLRNNGIEAHEGSRLD